MDNDFFNIIIEMSKLANKELGQNYLIELDVAKQIADLLDLGVNDNVLEIGCGFGSLSVFLFEKKFKKLTLNDIDQRALDFVKNLKMPPNVIVVNKSALKLNLKSYNKIISNLPYYLTNDLIENCLCKSNAQRLVFMCQKEVLNRLLAKPNESEYGPLAILINYFGNIQKELAVSRDAFLPKPHVDSLVFSITKTCDEKIDRYQYLQFLKRMFLHRRKTIFNNLSLFLMNKQKASKILEECHLSILLRPEQIEPASYLSIFQHLN